MELFGLIVPPQFKPNQNSVWENEFFLSNYHWTHERLPIDLVICEFDLQFFKLGLFEQMDIHLPGEIKNAVVKRKAEFLAGRFAAKEVTKALKKDGSHRLEIKIGKNREPVWPKGMRGSITHNTSTALCMMTCSDKIISLGVDIETILSEDLSDNIAEQVCSVHELQAAFSKGLIKRLAVTLIFSAKESIFKAFYPKVGEYFEFDKATLLEIDLFRNLMHFELDHQFAQKHNLPFLIEVLFSSTDTMILTMVLLGD